MARAKKPFSKEDILRAMRHTRSNRAACRYLGCSYQHYKPIAKMYLDEASGLDLFELHKNQSGKGIPKHIKGSDDTPALVEILEGRLDPSHFSPEKIKSRLIYESFLLEECAKCGFNERRVIDYKIPLLLNFKDKNKKNYNLVNLELLCYNCFYLYVGSVFTDEQIEQIQDFTTHKSKIEPVTWDLNPEQIENMKALGLWEEEKEDDLISRV